jgi:prepilin-type N-terminal cleavage/methylation domain-containing protein
MTTRRLFSAYLGFTIIELLVVISVIAILAAITLVSYSGVSSRATIATIQSDLSSASTALRLDQVTSSSFPASLALANNARGITSSQSLDSTIYIPDNTSNPNNFCLQYRKGTNTYAVDATTQPSKGVCLQNLVTNGDFSNGVTGWNLSGAPQIISTTGGYVTMLADTRDEGLIQYLTVVSGDTYYWRFNAISSKAATGDGPYTFISNITNFTTKWIINSQQSYSYVGPATSTSANIYLRDYRTVGFDNYSFGNFVLVDLTASFGAGNEPTKATMDTIMSNYPNSWFNITAKANL